MTVLRLLERPASVASLLVAGSVAAATWLGCGPSTDLPTGTWDGAAGVDKSPGDGGVGGGEVDASMSGASSTEGADAGVTPGATPDSGEPAEGGSRSAGAATDATMDLDAGSPLTTFTLLDTSVTTVVDGQAVPGWDPIPEESTINLAKVGTALSIRANPTPATVGSVLFVLDGTTMHTENSAPYTECSDNGAGTVNPCVYSEGKHTLVVTPHTAADLGGTAMPSTTLYFTIVQTSGDGGTDAAAD